MQLLIGLLASAIELIVDHRLLIQLLLHLTVATNLLVYMLLHQLLLLLRRKCCRGDLFKDCRHVSHRIDDLI